MRLLIFSDLHGRLNNIEKIITSNVYDDYLFAGDFFGYFACGNEIIDFFVKNNIKFILGNHDMYFLRELNPELFNNRFGHLNSSMISSIDYDKKYGCLFETIKNINNESVNYLYNSALSTNFTIDNLRFLLCHGSPYNTFDQYIYPDYENMTEIFLDFDFDILISGHTHKPFYTYNKDCRRVIINPGSCTLPRDTNRPSFAVIDTKTLNVEINFIKQKILFIRETKSKLIELEE